MKPHRDMTAAQFAAALKRYGMVSQGFMGYYNLGIPGHHCEATVLNAGPTRREQLAYLLHVREWFEKQHAAEAERKEQAR